MKVGDLIEAKYNARGQVAIILEITPHSGGRPFALVKFAHQTHRTRVFLNNFEAIVASLRKSEKSCE
jgi:hypothetical protein